jgi:hypothetical protein
MKPIGDADFPKIKSIRHGEKNHRRILWPLFSPLNNRKRKTEKQLSVENLFPFLIPMSFCPRSWGLGHTFDRGRLLCDQIAFPRGDSNLIQKGGALPDAQVDSPWMSQEGFYGGGVRFRFQPRFCKSQKIGSIPGAIGRRTIHVFLHRKMAVAREQKISRWKTWRNFQLTPLPRF